jgi:ArsR family transcriptional regulator, zinc-responsive transcriptional repressor
MNVEEKVRILEKKSQQLRALANPARLCIINCILQNTECNVRDLERKINKPQSTISQHLNTLKATNIVEGKKNGREIKYSIIDEGIKQIVLLLLAELNADGAFN